MLKWHYAIIPGLFLAVSRVQGNLIWPELMVVNHIMAHFLTLVVLSLLVEWPFVKKVTKTTLWYSGVLTCFANAVSMSIGQVVYVCWGLLSSVILDHILGGTFSVPRQVIAGISLATINALLELAAVVLVSKNQGINRVCSKVSFSVKNFGIFFLANFISALLTLGYIMVRGSLG